jgi:hypothetical protein
MYERARKQLISYRKRVWCVLKIEIKVLEELHLIIFVHVLLLNITILLILESQWKDLVLYLVVSARASLHLQLIAYYPPISSIGVVSFLYVSLNKHDK